MPFGKVIKEGCFGFFEIQQTGSHCRFCRVVIMKYFFLVVELRKLELLVLVWFLLEMYVLMIFFVSEVKHLENHTTTIVR
jgi:hypothetical protein